eukprot:gene45650-56882_t
MISLYAFKQIADQAVDKKRLTEHSIMFSFSTFKLKCAHFNWYPQLYLIGVVLTNMFVVTFVNVVYVYLSSTESAAIVHSIQFLVAIFKVLWNNVAVRGLLRSAKKVLLRLNQPADIINISVEVYMLLFNNIFAPFIAIAFVSSNCFLNIVQQAPQVTASYSYNMCSSYVTNTTNGVTTVAGLLLPELWKP